MGGDEVDRLVSPPEAGADALHRPLVLRYCIILSIRLRASLMFSMEFA
jgi:hypothetical protein